MSNLSNPKFTEWTFRQCEKDDVLFFSFELQTLQWQLKLIDFAFGWSSLKYEYWFKWRLQRNYKYQHHINFENVSGEIFLRFRALRCWKRNSKRFITFLAWEKSHLFSKRNGNEKSNLNRKLNDGSENNPV